MMNRLYGLLLSFFVVLFFNGVCNADTVPMPTKAPSSTIDWQAWSNKPFEQAKASHRFVLVFIKEDGCHWCQLTKDVTFHDKNVIKIINSNYIPVRLDIDADADLIRQFQVGALPTFIIMNSNKKVIEEFSGYTSPEDMAAKLQ